MGDIIKIIVGLFIIGFFIRNCEKINEIVDLPDIPVSDTSVPLKSQSTINIIGTDSIEIMNARDIMLTDVNLTLNKDYHYYIRTLSIGEKIIIPLDEFRNSDRYEYYDPKTNHPVYLDIISNEDTLEVIWKE